MKTQLSLRPIAYTPLDISSNKIKVGEQLSFAEHYSCIIIASAQCCFTNLQILYIK